MKKKQAGSAEAAVAAAVNAAKGLPEVPAHVRLRPEDLPFWDGIVRARAREEWTGPHLVVAAQLARCQQDIEVESITLDGEGTVVTNDRGTPVCNPRVAVLEQLARREMALMRSLAISGRVAGDPRHLDASRRIQREADKTREELAEDELLAS
jgi:hypothetical protein